MNRVSNFLSINRFERKKNIEVAVSAFSLLLRHQESPGDFTLTIAGGYDERLRENLEYLEELRGLAKEEGVSKRDEHFGIVPLEALAAYGETGYLCNSNPEDFSSSAMARFIENPELVLCRKED